MQLIIPIQSGSLKLVLLLYDGTTSAATAAQHSERLVNQKGKRERERERERERAFAFEKVGARLSKKNQVSEKAQKLA